MSDDEGPIILAPEPSNDEVLRLLEETKVSAEEEEEEVLVDDNDELVTDNPAQLQAAAVRLTLAWATQNHPQSRGIMITASHLPEPYNGLVLVGVNGGNVDSDLQGQQETLPQKPVLHVGYDTRSTSQALAQWVVQTARAAGVPVHQHGEVTTPCLRYCVRDANHNDTTRRFGVSCRPNERGYYNTLAQAYAQLVSTVPKINDEPVSLPTNSLLIDCAGGIGYLQVRQVVTAMQKLGVMRRMVATNRIGSAPLNETCGAAHVVKYGTSPQWYNRPPIGKGYCAALSGDADRVVFFYESDNDTTVVWPPAAMTALMLQFVQAQVQAVAPTAALTCGVCVATQHDAQCMAEILGDSVPIVTTKADDWDIVVSLQAHGQITVQWGSHFCEAMVRLQPESTNEFGVKRLSAVSCLWTHYPDGLATLLLVDAILQIQYKTLQDVC